MIIRLLVGTALAALLLVGCSSANSTGSGSAATSATSTGAATASTAASLSQTRTETQPVTDVSPPARAGTELARLVITKGAVTTLAGVAPISGHSYLAHGRCVSTGGKLIYSVVDAADNSKVWSSGEITCNRSGETANTALLTGLTTKPITLVLQNSSGDVSSGYLIVTPE